MSAAITATTPNTDDQGVPTSSRASTGTTLPSNENQSTSGTTVDATALGTNDDGDDSSEDSEDDSKLYMCE